MKIELKNVTCGYHNEDVLSELNLSFETGEFWCILGANGIGKTTLFKTLLGFIELRSGKIILNNRNISDIGTKELSSYISYVPQAKSYSLQYTVLDTVLMGRANHIKQFSSPTDVDYSVSKKMLEKLGIGHLSNCMYSELSGGEQQVVLIARALAQETIASLQEAGIPCVDVGMKTADDLLRAVDIVATTFGTDHSRSVASAYKEKFAYYQDYVKSCVQDIPENAIKSVLVIGDLTDITGFGKNAYEAYWASVAGLNYIVPSDDGASKVNLTMEQIFEFDPDVVIVETFDTSLLTEDSTWFTLRAYTDGRVLAAPKALDNWSKPGAESMMVYLWALNMFYPDYAGKLDLTTEVRNFYKDFYGYDMTEEYAKIVMHGEDVTG